MMHKLGPIRNKFEREYPFKTTSSTRPRRLPPRVYVSAQPLSQSLRGGSLAGPNASGRDTRVSGSSSERDPEAGPSCALDASEEEGSETVSGRGRKVRVRLRVQRAYSARETSEPELGSSLEVASVTDCSISDMEIVVAEEGG